MKEYERERTPSRVRLQVPKSFAPTFASKNTWRFCSAISTCMKIQFVEPPRRQHPSHTQALNLGSAQNPNPAWSARERGFKSVHSCGEQKTNCDAWPSSTSKFLGSSEPMRWKVFCQGMASSECIDPPNKNNAAIVSSSVVHSNPLPAGCSSHSSQNQTRGRLSRLQCSDSATRGCSTSNNLRQTHIAPFSHTWRPMQAGQCK